MITISICLFDALSGKRLQTNTGQLFFKYKDKFFASRIRFYLILRYSNIFLIRKQEMIEYIKGEIIELSPTRMIMECAGIGYELNISLTSYSAFNGKSSGRIYVYEVIREDAHLLFGFATKQERELFLLLTSVSGVGPNTARMILSSLPPSELIQTIATNKEDVLKSVKGIGLKTAQRIIVDLKNKVKLSEGDAAGMMDLPMENIQEEAVAALLMLGFQKMASQKAVAAICKNSPGLSVEQVIKTALRML